MTISSAVLQRFPCILLYLYAFMNMYARVTVTVNIIPCSNCDLCRIIFMSQDEIMTYSQKWRIRYSLFCCFTCINSSCSSSIIQHINWSVNHFNPTATCYMQHSKVVLCKYIMLYRVAVGWNDNNLNPWIQAGVWLDCTNRSHALNRSQALHTSRVSIVGSASESKRLCSTVEWNTWLSRLTYCLPSVCCNADVLKEARPWIKPGLNCSGGLTWLCNRSWEL